MAHGGADGSRRGQSGIAQRMSPKKVEGVTSRWLEGSVDPNARLSAEARIPFHYFYFYYYNLQWHGVNLGALVWLCE